MINDLEILSFPLEFRKEYIMKLNDDNTIPISIAHKKHTTSKVDCNQNNDSQAAYIKISQITYAWHYN